MPRPVTHYECSDGRTFTTERAAEAHEALIALESWYDAQPLYSTYGSRVEFEELCQWVRDNPNEVKSLISTIIEEDEE